MGKIFRYTIYIASVISLALFASCIHNTLGTPMDISNLSIENTVKNALYSSQAVTGTTPDTVVALKSDDIEWVTMQGGLDIHTKALFQGNDDEKINRIVNMINSGTGKTESTDYEIGVIHSMARPIGICFQLKDGSKVYAWTDYTTKSFKDGWSATTLDDRFVLDFQKNGEDKYFTVFSVDVAKYLKQGWKDDMPIVRDLVVKSESNADVDKVSIRNGDTAVVTGDGCTAKEVVISIMRNGNVNEVYTVGKVLPKYGCWEWKGVISRQLETLDGKTFTLAKDLYDINMDAGGNKTGVCGVIDLRGEN